VIGLGKVAQLHHLPNLAEAPEFDLVGLCDLSADLGARLAERYGLDKVAYTTDHRDLLDQDLDAVVVANRHHGPVVLDALAAGKHVFVEKPLCWGRDEADEIQRAQQRTGLTVVVGYMKRFDPAVERLVATADTDLCYARLHNFAGGRHRHERLHPVFKPTGLTVEQGAAENDAIDAAVRRCIEHAGAVGTFRTLAELASHDLNLARALLGTGELEWARSYQAGGSRSYLALFRHGGTPAWLELVPDFRTPRDWDEEVTLYGESGATGLRFASPFLLNAPTVLWERGADGTDVVERELVVSRESPYLRELRHFHRCVTAGEQPRTSVADAVADLDLLYQLAARIEPA
jgi:predicted dehydrogenase